MLDPLTRPVVRVELSLADGSTLVREWSINDNPPEVEMQPWMVGPSRAWPHPQDPITFKAKVLSGDTETAERWLSDLGQGGQNDGA